MKIDYSLAKSLLISISPAEKWHRRDHNRYAEQMRLFGRMLSTCTMYSMCTVYLYAGYYYYITTDIKVINN